MRTIAVAIVALLVLILVLHIASGLTSKPMGLTS